MQLWQPEHSESEQQPDSGIQESPLQHFEFGASQHALEPSATGQHSWPQHPSAPQHWNLSGVQHSLLTAQNTSGHGQHSSSP
jgi:hypothetical protein